MGRANWHYGKHPPKCTCASCTREDLKPPQLGERRAAEWRGGRYREMRLGDFRQLPLIWQLRRIRRNVEVAFVRPVAGLTIWTVKRLVVLPVLAFLALWKWHFTTVGDAGTAAQMVRDDIRTVAKCPQDFSTLWDFIRRNEIQWAEYETQKKFLGTDIPTFVCAK